MTDGDSCARTLAAQYWPVIRATVREQLHRIVAACRLCINAAQRAPVAVARAVPRSVIRVTPAPNIRFQVDLKELPRASDGYKYVLFVTDVYSRYLWGFPLKDKTCKGVADALAEVFQYCSAPLILQSDWGAEFNGPELRDLLARYNVRHVHSRPRHPQSNGVVERTNRCFSRYLHVWWQVIEANGGNWRPQLAQFLALWYSCWRQQQDSRLAVSLALRMVTTPKAKGS